MTLPRGARYSEDYKKSSAETSRVMSISFRDQAVTQFASGENENLPAQKRAATATAGDNDGFVEAFPSRYFGPEGHAGVYFLC